MRKTVHEDKDHHETGVSRGQILTMRSQWKPRGKFQYLSEFKVQFQAKGFRHELLGRRSRSKIKRNIK